MSRRVIYTDTETTGFSDSDDQILEWAAVVDDENGNQVEEVEELVRLKHGVNPNPTAVATHGINALSKKHTESAVTEAKMVNNLIQLAKRHTINGVKPLVCAQNAKFDISFYSAAFTRQGKKLSDYISKSEVDSLKIFDKAIKSGDLVTKQGRFGMSKSLESVAEALHIKYEGNGAHRALSDAKVMREAVKAIFPKVSNGIQIHQMSSDSPEFKNGEIRKVTMTSQAGTKTRNIYVLGNDISDQKIYFLEEGGYDVKNGVDSLIKEVDYSSIVSDSSPDKDSELSLKSTYERNKNDIDHGLIKRLDGKSLEFDTEKPAEIDFSTIELVRSRMNSAKNKIDEHSAISSFLSKDRGLSKSEIAAVLLRAEKLQASMGLKTWSEEIGGKKNLSIMRAAKNGESIEVGCHPSGNYYLLMNYGDGMMLKEIFGSKAKLKTAILSKTAIKEEAEALIKSLPAQSAFEDKKHPISLASEIQLALDKARGNPESTEALMTLIEFYKEQYPETYKGLGDPSKATEIDKGYFKGEEETIDSQMSFPGVTQSETTKQNVEPVSEEGYEDSPSDHNQLSLDDHAPRGQSKSSVKCSMCMRPISKEISLAMGMGPTCRLIAKSIDSSESSPEYFVESFTKYTRDSSLKIKKGASLVMKFKNRDGSTESLFVDSIRFNLDSEVVFVDRRELNRLLNAGEDVEIAEYRATIKRRESDIDSFGKVSSKKVDLQKSA